MLCQLDNILVFVKHIEIHVINFRCFLEEAVLIMPGHQIIGGHTAACSEFAIHFRLQLREGRGGEFVEFVKQRCDFFRILFAHLQLHGVVIREAKLLGHSIAHTDKAEYIRRRYLAYDFAGGPGRLKIRAIGRRAQNFFYFVVSELFSVDFRPKR